MSQDSQPIISLASIMSKEEEATAGEPAVASSSLPRSTTAARQAPTPEALGKANALALDHATTQPLARQLDAHTILLAALPEHAALRELYAHALPAARVQMWRQIDARDAPQRHVLLPLVLAHALRATELEQSAALQAGLRLGHPALTQVAVRMFERSSHKVRFASVQVLEELGDREAHYFLTQQLTQTTQELDSALLIAIRRALHKIAERHPVGEHTSGGGLTLSSMVEPGALSLEEEHHAPRLDELLGVQITRLLGEESVELLADTTSSAVKPASDAFIALKATEARQAKIVRTILFNEHVEWRLSIVLMMATVGAQIIVTIVYQPLMFISALSLLPYVASTAHVHASTVEQVVFGGRIARTSLDLPAEASAMATAELKDEQGDQHKRYFTLTEPIRDRVRARPDMIVHVAWHPDAQDAYLLEAHDYLDVDAQGALILTGSSKAALLVSLLLCNVVTYIFCVVVKMSIFTSSPGTVMFDVVTTVISFTVLYAIKLNRDAVV